MANHVLDTHPAHQTHLTPHWSPYLRLCWAAPLSHPQYTQVKMACAQRADQPPGGVGGGYGYIVAAPPTCMAGAVQHLSALWCTWAHHRSPFIYWPRVRHWWRHGIAFCPDHTCPTAYHEAVVLHATYGWVQLGAQEADDPIPADEVWRGDGLLASAHPHL